MNRTELSRQRALLNRRFETKYFPKVKAEIKKEIDNVKSIVRSEGIHSAMNYLHKQIHSKGLPQIIEQLYLEVGLRYARSQQRMFNEQRRTQSRVRMGKGIGTANTVPSFETKGFGFNAQWVNFIKNYLYRFLLQKITFQVAETTREVLLNVLDKAVTEGWGIDKTVSELEDLPLSETQAARIVRTEITRAANTGLSAASSTFQFEQTKEWISAHDMRTRGQRPSDHASHILLDGQVIDEDRAFVDPINGDHLMFPGDPNGSAASVINCRCNVAYVAKVNERGRLIPKRRVAA